MTKFTSTHLSLNLREQWWQNCWYSKAEDLTPNIFALESHYEYDSNVLQHGFFGFFCFLFLIEKVLYFFATEEVLYKAIYPN